LLGFLGFFFLRSFLYFSQFPLSPKEGFSSMLLGLDTTVPPPPPSKQSILLKLVVFLFSIDTSPDTPPFSRPPPVEDLISADPPIHPSKKGFFSPTKTGLPFPPTALFFPGGLCVMAFFPLPYTQGDNLLTSPCAEGFPFTTKARISSPLSAKFGFFKKPFLGWGMGRRMLFPFLFQYTFFPFSFPAFPPLKDDALPFPRERYCFSYLCRGGFFFFRVGPPFPPPHEVFPPKKLDYVFFPLLHRWGFRP